GYKQVLLASIRWRYLSLGLGVVSLFLTIVAYAFLNHGAEFFPETEPDRANVFVRTSEGTGLEQTDRVVREIEGMLAGLENIDVWVAEPGVVSDGNALGPSSSATNQARITVDFLPDKSTAHPGEKIRVEPTSVTIDHLRKLVAEVPGAAIRIEKERMGPPVGKPIG
ncbi:MAG: efflux RND transporter permease subunit, partial [Myxococcales bacterium]|nr:efflux RND transporter permease subunit [Myxococcales bacterium]